MYCGSAIAATGSFYPSDSSSLCSSLGAQLSTCFTRSAADPPDSAGVMHSILDLGPYAGRLFASDLMLQPRSDQQELTPDFPLHSTVLLPSFDSLLIVVCTQYS